MWHQNDPRSHWLSCVSKTNPEDNPIDAAVSSLGIKEGKESESEVVIMDMLRKRIHEQMAGMDLKHGHCSMLAVMKINKYTT